MATLFDSSSVDYFELNQLEETSASMQVPLSKFDCRVQVEHLMSEEKLFDRLDVEPVFQEHCGGCQELLSRDAVDQLVQ
jgi:hypothetical protein